jgi:hypothetical protein
MKFYQNNSYFNINVTQVIFLSSRRGFLPTPSLHGTIEALVNDASKVLECGLSLLRRWNEVNL